jgi:ethanolamine-phosphate cytidylyltransferase
MVIVYADMVADIFHSGHVKFLEKASQLGDFLIVGINSGEDAASYKRFPILSLEDRVKVIESCKYVSKVIAPCPLIVTEEFIKLNNIDIVVHAHDKDDTNYDFMYKDPIRLGKFVRLDYTSGISTTEIIKRCCTISCNQHFATC